MKKYTNLILALATLCLVGLACKTFTEGKPAAEAAVKEFHSMLDEGRFSEIYAASDQRLKDATSEEDMIKIFNVVHTKLGNVKESTQTTWRAGNFNLTTTVVLEQATTFENGKGTETFTFVIDGKKALLAGYFINSTDLMLK